MKKRISIVVPFYNEEENAPILGQRIADVFAGLPEYDYECLFVNDGSTDGTRAALDTLHQKNPNIIPVHLKENCGQSAALIAGMRKATGEYILTLDGDLQNDPEDFQNILPLLEEYDCVCGYRATRNDTWIRKMSSRIANAVRGRILQDNVRDTGCGTKGFRRTCLEHIIPFNGVHRFFPALLQNAGLTIVEIPVSHHPRVHGTSKYGIGNRLWRGIYDLIGVTWLKKRLVYPKVEGE